MNLDIPLDRSVSLNAPSGPASPALNTIEDLNRFPTESLHSFSFAHQSEESLDRRQNVLKRATDFFRDRLGWAASNPGLVAAQAKLSGDQEVQSMVELLARAQFIGEDAERAHGLAGAGPMTGPADLSGENVFDRSFNIPRSESPVGLGIDDSGLTSARRDSASRSGGGRERDLGSEKSITLETLSKATTDGSIDRVAPPHPRSMLKRTYTNLDDLTMQSKLQDTLAEPYSVSEAHHESVLSPRTLPTIASMSKLSTSAGHQHPAPHTAAPHGHGSRWAPAHQAIFTTEAATPWTITAANDLACLVFGVTRAEVRKLGILEVVRPERRKWLEEKLKDPDGGSAKGKGGYSHSQRSSPNHTTSLNVGSGITARLLSKPNSRATSSAASKRRAQTEDGSGMSYSQRSKNKGGPNHPAHKSRGVLLCGDVVPIQKRNGALGSASLWVKEKKGGLIWVLEEIAEDIAYMTVDEIGCITSTEGATAAIWEMESIRKGTDVKRLLPDLPKLTGTYTGALDFDSIAETRTYTAKTKSGVSIPVTVDQLSGNSTFRVSSFPHIAGIMVLNSTTLKISSSNAVFSNALFGQAHPDGLHISDILPGFDKILDLLTAEDQIQLVDGIVIPEHSFRRARAVLGFREGKTDAASIFLRPTGLPARHRDGSEVMVDVQMRVVKSEKSAPALDEEVIEEEAELEEVASRETEVVYALWITYSRQLHAAAYNPTAAPPMISRPLTPPHQPSPGQSSALPTPMSLEGDDSDSKQPVSLLTQQLKGDVQPVVSSTDGHLSRSISGSEGEQRKKRIDDFVILEEMGQGAYGQVKLCRYKKGQGKVVIKYVTKRRILVDTWTRDRKLGTVPLEIHVLNYLRRDDLRHPNIVDMADFFEDDINYYIEMVPHGLPGMDLFDYIELRVNMDEAECRKIFVQVAQAIFHLHIKAKVVHRDIKDENVILDGEGNIKLIDFGSAAYIKSGPFDVFVGTIGMFFPASKRTVTDNGSRLCST
jgi:protein-serine/threonine kinase